MKVNIYREGFQETTSTTDCFWSFVQSKQEVLSRFACKYHAVQLADQCVMSHTDSSSTSMSRVTSKQIRNLVGFWFLGFCNNFAYVIMLSAANDITDEDNKKHNTSSLTTTTAATTTTTTTGHGVHYLECNKIGTGAILLADILPTLLVKLTAPFYLQKIPSRLKVLVIIMLSAASFLLVGLASNIGVRILGVICASFGAGFGEITFLSMTAFFDRNVISTWSSGTGAAGLFGALAYAGLTSVGVSPRSSVLLMLVIPVLLAFSYFLLLTDPPRPVQSEDKRGLLSNGIKRVNLTLNEKLKIISHLWIYMVPLSVVYFGEYFINQGLHELLYYNGIWLSKNEQYRWYQVDYQLGVLISRSSVNLFKINKIWVLAVLQIVNMVLLLLQVFYRFIPNIWIIFFIVLYEGLLGGAAYVNTFYKMSKEIHEEIREFCLGVVTVADSLGISIAGAIALPTHNHICRMKLKI